jgi:hypothetical protein
MHEIDKLVALAFKQYLRTCLSGGMPIRLSEQMLAAVECAAGHNYFSLEIIMGGYVKKSIETDTKCCGWYYGA